MNPPKEPSLPSAVTSSLQQSVSSQALGLNSKLLASVEHNMSAVPSLASPTDISFSGNVQVATVSSSEMEPSSKSVCLPPLSLFLI